MFSRGLISALVLGLAGCGPAPPAAPPVAHPTLAVAVPLSGPDAHAGRAAVEGVTLAAGLEVEVLAVDDTLPDAMERLAANPHVFGVVAHVTRRAAEDRAESWRASDLPVVVAAPGSFTGLPRVVPPIAESARCAAAFVEGAVWIRTDSSPVGMAAGRALIDRLPDRALGVDTIDGAHVSVDAARITGNNAAAVAWTGDAAAGGNLLRMLRKVGSDEPFLGVGLYDTRFLEAAGAAAEGARVTSEGRPAQDPEFVSAYVAANGRPPSGPAVDAYEAAAVLMAAWRIAGNGLGAEGPTRAHVRTALPGIVARGANGFMTLGADDFVRPVVCASFVVTDGTFLIERFASEADAPPRLPRRRRR